MVVAHTDHVSFNNFAKCYAQFRLYSGIIEALKKKKRLQENLWTPENHSFIVLKIRILLVKSCVFLRLTTSIPPNKVHYQDEMILLKPEYSDYFHGMENNFNFPMHFLVFSLNCFSTAISSICGKCLITFFC